MGNFLVPVFEVIIYLLNIYWWIVILAAIFSWLTAFGALDSRNRAVYTIGNFLYRATEPALRPIQRILPNFGGLDISPVVLLLIIYFIERELTELALYLVR